MATELPEITAFTNSSIEEGQFKTAVANLRTYLAGLLGVDGETTTALMALGSFCNAAVFKTAAYTVLPVDRGKVFVCSSAFTLSFSAATVLGNGFCIAIRNIGASNITLDPNASELINGQATMVLSPGSSAVVMCDGSAWRTIGDYTLPVASGSSLGGVIIGDNLEIDGNGVLSSPRQGGSLLWSADGERESLLNSTSWQVYPGMEEIYRNVSDIDSIRFSSQIASQYVANTSYMRLSVGSLVSAEVSHPGIILEWVSAAIDVSALSGLQQIKIEYKSSSDTGSAYKNSNILVYAGE